MIKEGASDREILKAHRREEALLFEEHQAQALETTLLEVIRTEKRV